MKKCQKLFLLLTLFALLPSHSAYAWEDGIYRDQADGYGGKVIVTVTIRKGIIQSLTTENTGGEKSEYYLKAEETLSEAIVSANGLEGVDTVSGATGTSESILMAMTGILEQASYTGTNTGMETGADQSNGTDTAGAAGSQTSISEGTPDDPASSVKQPTLTPEPKATV